MAESKKYYWLKLKRDFFKRHDIRIIEEMPNGKDYILFYLKLLCESVDHDGKLRFSDAIPYNEQMLSVVTNTNVDIVRCAIKVFSELNMMDVLDDGTLYMSEVQNMIGSAADNDNANRQRRFREKQKQLSLPDRYDAVTKNNESKSIEKETEKEKEIEEEIEFIPASPTKSPKPTRHKYGMYNNVLLSDEDYQKLHEEFPHDYTERIDRLSEYIASTGKSYKSHLATIRAWSRKEKPTKEKSSNPFLDMLKEEGGF